MNSKIIANSSLAQGVRKTGNLPGDFIVRDVMDMIFTVDPWMYPLSQILFTSERVKTMPVINPTGKKEWIEDEIIWDTDTMGSGLTGGATGTFTATTPALFLINQVLRFEETDETVRVSDISGTTITVAKIGASNFSTVTTGTRVFIIGMANGENSSPPEARNTYGVFRYNYPQIFQETCKITDRMWAATNAGGTYGGNQYAEDIRKKAIRMRADIEKTFKLGGAPDIQTINTDEYLTITGSLEWQIKNFDGVQDHYSGDSLDEDELDGILGNMEHGSPYKTILAGGDVYMDLERIIKKRWNIDGPITKYSVLKDAPGLKCLTYATNNIECTVIKDPQMKFKYSKWFFILEEDNLGKIYWPNDKKGTRMFRFEEGIQANGQPREEGQFLADVGCALLKSPVHALVTPQS